MRSRTKQTRKRMWDRYQFWQALWVTLSAGSGLLIGLLWLVELVGGDRIAVVVLAFAWTIAWAVATWRLATFVCPNCGQRCNMNGTIAWYNVFKPRCVHCGHDRLDDSPEP